MSRPHRHILHVDASSGKETLRKATAEEQKQHEAELAALEEAERRESDRLARIAADAEAMKAGTADHDTRDRLLLHLLGHISE